MGTLLYKWDGKNKVLCAGPFRCREEIYVFEQVAGSNWGSIDGGGGFDTIDETIADLTGCENVEFWYSEEYGFWKEVVVRSMLPGWTNAPYLDASKDYYRFYDASDSFDEIKALVPYNDALAVVWSRTMEQDGGSWDTYREMLNLPAICPNVEALVSRVDDIDELCEAGFPIGDLLPDLDSVDAFLAASPSVRQLLSDALSDKLTDIDYLMENQDSWNEWAEMIESGVPIEDIFA